MEKSEYLYNSTSQFEAEKETLDNKKHYTAETIDDKNIHFKNKRVILPIKPVEESVAADICLVENSTLNKYIVDGNSYSVDLFPAEQYTPIGVVVVPASHTDDGTARVISLVAMNPNTPDSGSTEGHTNIYWGGDDYDVPDLPYKTQAPWIGTAASALTDTQVLQGFTSLLKADFSSDYYDNSYPNPFDEGTCFGEDYKMLAPSPYLTGGLRNEIYHSTENTGNAYADMDGKSNTEKILSVDNGAGIDWQTAATITNTGNTETIHPAAQCCWRYHTIGTNQGDWYLPAGGELGYLAARWKAINSSITKIRSFGVFHSLELPVTSGWWSSTEYSSSRAVNLYLRSIRACLDFNYKDYFAYATYVRAFFAV